ncbi:MAG: pentapeptide repeat-containing protein [Myxococcota bacterium]|nr:pentapeptide repeat-containing protein [Myxococcota bacterium]
MELLQLLEQEKVDEFNASRGLSTRIDLFAADLADKNLTGVNLTGVNLQKADLSGCNLTDAELSQTDLSGADLTGAVLKNISAMRSRWRDAYLGEADLSDADLAGADLTDADVSDGSLARAMLTGARLKRAVLVGTDLSAADLAEAYMVEADLSRANLTGAQMREANLSGADLNETKLMSSDLTQVKMAGAALTQTDLTGACLNSADLTESEWANATVDGTDFTRADLTGADVQNTDFGSATMTDAQLDDGIQGGVTIAEDIGIASVHVEDPQLAVNGSKIAVTWENPDRQGKPSLRIATGTAGKGWTGSTARLPVPADLAVANALVAIGDGFLGTTLLDRPGGAMVQFSTLGRGGKVVKSRSVKLGYAPVVRPEVRVIDGEVLLFGISRHGPTIRVDKLTDEGLEPTFGKTMPTARGFVPGPIPHVLSKGGVIVPISSRGMGEPMRVPPTFPGRAQVAAPVEDGLALAWIPSSGKGFRFCIARPGQAPEEQAILPKVEIGTLDMTSDGSSAWVVFTRESDSAAEASPAWVVSLPNGTPEPLHQGEEDAYTIHFASQTPGDTPTVGVVTFDGALTVYALGKRGPKQKFHIAGPANSPSVM